MIIDMVTSEKIKELYESWSLCKTLEIYITNLPSGKADEFMDCMEVYFLRKTNIELDEMEKTIIEKGISYWEEYDSFNLEDDYV